jgi:hypothetical protein
MLTATPEKCTLKDITVKVLSGEYKVNHDGSAIISKPVEQFGFIISPEYVCKLHNIRGSWNLIKQHLEEN